MSFWCEIRQTHVTPPCACCGRATTPRPKVGINEQGEIDRRRRPRVLPLCLWDPVDWTEMVRDEPAAPARPSVGQGHVNESGEIVRDEPGVDWRAVVEPSEPLHVTSPHSPYRSAKIWCECRPPLPRGVDVHHWQVRCRTCWRVRRGERTEPAPPLKPTPPWQESPSPAPKRRTVRPWERVVVLILLLLAAIVVYLGWRF